MSMSRIRAMADHSMDVNRLSVSGESRLKDFPNHFKTPYDRVLALAIINE